VAVDPATGRTLSEQDRIRTLADSDRQSTDRRPPTADP
jgi:hypothetical protein